MNSLLVGVIEEQPLNKYFLVENDGTYGIMISNGEAEECIEDLFGTKETAEQFADMLFRNNVSPVHLKDVVYDYIY